MEFLFFSQFSWFANVKRNVTRCFVMLPSFLLLSFLCLAPGFESATFRLRFGHQLLPLTGTASAESITSWSTLWPVSFCWNFLGSPSFVFTSFRLGLTQFRGATVLSTLQLVEGGIDSFFYHYRS